MTISTPLEMIAIWRQGCSVSAERTDPDDLKHEGPQPELCPECTRGLVDGLEVWLRMPLWKRVWLQSRGYVWLRKYVAWKMNQHPDKRGSEN